MEPGERRNAEEARLEVATHGEGMQERTRVEAGVRLHKYSFAAGGRGGGGKRRESGVKGERLSALGGIHESVDFWEQRVAHRGVAEPGHESMAEMRAHLSLLRRTRPPRRMGRATQSQEVEVYESDIEVAVYVSAQTATRATPTPTLGQRPKHLSRRWDGPNLGMRSTGTSRRSSHGGACKGS